MSIFDCVFTASDGTTSVSYFCRKVAHDILLEAYEAFGQFRGTSEAELSAWLKQILRRNVANLARDHRAARRDIRREKYLDDAGDASVSVTWLQPAGRQTTASQFVVKAEAALNLALALEQLPEDQRTAVRMRHLEGHGVDDIARQMQKTAPAIAGLIRRGLQSLRLQLSGDTSWI